MKFAIMLDTNVGSVGRDYPDGAEVRQFYADLVHLAGYAEQAGFDGLFVPERHVRTDCFAPSTLGLLSAFASITERVDLASYVLLLPMYPIRALAEDYAQLDQLSHGRLIAGVGGGYHEGYFTAFETSSAKRGSKLADGVRQLREAWTSGHIGNTPILPPPYRPGGPPVWIGATTPTGIARAARLGDAWCVGFADSNFPRYVENYREACETEQRPATLVMLREAWVQSDARRARQHLDRLARVVEAEIAFYRSVGQLELRDDGEGRMHRLVRHMVVGDEAQALEHVASVVERYRPDYFGFRVHVGMFSRGEAEDCISVLARVSDAVRGAQ
jgi:alkanesulfonate monooxygenase SsuD/methylene tetrahydromethanopterin reductase-like flavin-dependent oxidoreductase (luciferase family)